MMKRTLTAAALAAVLAAPAFAQQPMGKTDTTNSSSSMSTTAQPGFLQQQNANDWRGSKLIGASVYGQDNASIGDISDVLIGSEGKIQAVVVGVGGFLGVGSKDVAVPFTALNITRKPNSTTIDKITVSYSKDQLKNAPKFAYYEPASSNTTTGSASGTHENMGLNSLSPKSNTSKH
jgi:sporulation protein YlmC with PRC-barrel domain